MGEAQSVESHEHSEVGKGKELSNAQKAFSNSHKLDKKDFPLMSIKVGESDEIKYADTRPHMLEKLDNKLHWEMFWMSELENINQELFVSQVKNVLEKYGGNVSGEMREAGCMISMIALPFTMSEEDSYKMGVEMFNDFGTDKIIEKKEETHQHKVTVVESPAQKAFSSTLKLNKKENFPLMLVKVDNQEFKYTDMRPHMLPNIGDDLHWEMFWMGELDNLDQKQFSSQVSTVIEKYGGKITSKMREAGCMLSMVSIAFSMPEKGTMEMGNDMFENFGKEIEN